MIHDDDVPSSSGSFWNESAQPARWRTLVASALSDSVRAALARTLRRGVTLPSMPELTVKGIATRDGFALDIARGRRRIGADLALSEFEGSTRVQISVPAEFKPTDAELRAIAEWVERVFARAKWTIR